MWEYVSSGLSEVDGTLQDYASRSCRGLKSMLHFHFHQNSPTLRKGSGVRSGSRNEKTQSLSDWIKSRPDSLSGV